jgi:transcriptional regulator with XRE-family HTH domain
MIQKGSTRISLPTVEQLRAARALLGWSQTELASKAGLSLPTVKRVEGNFGPAVSEDARLKLQQALEAAGLEFLHENGAGLGVRFRKSRNSKRR